MKLIDIRIKLALEDMHKSKWAMDAMDANMESGKKLLGENWDLIYDIVFQYNHDLNDQLVEYKTRKHEFDAFNDFLDNMKEESESDPVQENSELEHHMYNHKSQ